MSKTTHEKDVINIKDIFNNPARRIVTVDLERYKYLLDDPAMSDAQKEEFLQALWSIVVAFVELGFGVHPLQEVYEPGDGPSFDELKEAFDKAEQAESSEENKKGGSLADGLEVT